MERISRIFLAGMLILASLVRAQPVEAASCNDVEFIFARGSGEPLGGTNYDRWRTEITRQIVGSNLRYDFYELGTRSYNNFQYEAVAVSGSVEGFANLIGAKVSAGEAYKFGNSVKKGEQELLAYINVVTSSCPKTKFVLGGYSQGAMLMTHALNYIDPQRIIYVTNFGDPKTYLPEGKGNFPDACQGKNLSNYRAYVPDCHAYEGILGSYRPYQLEGFYDKIGLWCNNQDAMCSSGLSISDHTNYTENGMYERAAARIAERLRASFPEYHDITVDLSQITTQDVAIILDTSPSMMQGPYDHYLMRIRQLVNEVRSLGGRVALFYYGDHRFFPASCICDFETCTEEKINSFYNDYAKIGVIGHWAHNSGISATHKAVTELNWRADAPKSIVIFTDHFLSTHDMKADYLLEANQVVGATISTYTQQRLAFDEYIVRETGGKAYSEANADALASDITGVAPAELPTLHYIGAAHQEIYLDASRIARELQEQKPSSRQRSRSAQLPELHYDWDLNGDGEFEVLDGPAQISTHYDEARTGFVQVRVRNAAGNYRIALSEIEITSQQIETPSSSGVLEASARQLDATRYLINFETTADWLIVGLDEAVLGKIDPCNCTGLIVEDVTQPTTIYLKTFSEDATEVSQTTELILGENLSTNDPSIKDENNENGQNGQDSQDDQNSQGNQGNQSGQPAPSTPSVDTSTNGNVTNLVDRIPHLIQPVRPQILPKVPNAGTAS